MKKNDLIFIPCFIFLFIPFFISDGLMAFYEHWNVNYPFAVSYIKFAVLATLGEIIGLRIRKGIYYQKGFGILPRAFVWGFLGISIKTAFVIFGEGAPQMLSVLGFNFGGEHPAMILNKEFFSNPTFLHLLSAFSVSLTMNLFFAPVFMTIHKISDVHIHNTGGNFLHFFSKPDIGKIISNLNWNVHWNFVLKKTIPLFWIPAQTINFLLPGELRILVAALLGVVLGVILSVAGLKK